MEIEDWVKLTPMDNPALLISTDTGGQSEFLEIVSRFILGSPSLNLVFIKLTDELDDFYETYSTDQDHISGEKTTSDRPVIDVLFQTLASISCLKQTDSEHSLYKSGDDEDEYLNSKVLIIGTFKDKVCEDKIKEFNKRLISKIQTTQFYKDSLVEYFKEDEIVYPINNFEGDKEELKKFKKEIFKSHWASLKILKYLFTG